VEFVKFHDKSGLGGAYEIFTYTKSTDRTPFAPSLVKFILTLIFSARVSFVIVVDILKVFVVSEVPGQVVVMLFQVPLKTSTAQKLPLAELNFHSIIKSTFFMMLPFGTFV